MSWKKIVTPFIFIVLLLVPTAALAVDFEISDVIIDAHLQENGDAAVVEKHIYVFDGKFNGVTREVVAKTGAAIADFEAYEKGKSLKVENDEGTYKIFRSGKNETIEIEMRYQIINAVEKYTDGAQFYWPFFDKRNETDYDNMIITIYPPGPAKEIQYLGYDTAYKTGTVNNNGDVSFKMGKVSSGKNGDVRVIYEPELFPSAKVNKGKIRGEIEFEKKQLADEESAYLVRQDKAGNFGLFGMAGFGAFLIGLFGKMITTSRMKKRTVHEHLADTLVPKERLSMPATIHYMNYGVFSPEAMSAALLDLIRKGHVVQLSDDEFEVVNRSVAYNHEAALLELLFDQVGNGTIFRIADLETYTKEEKNHEIYSSASEKWMNAILEEVKMASLHEKKTRLRWSVALLSLAFIPVVVQLGRYEFFLYMSIAIFMTIVGLSFAIFYNPRNEKGFVLFEEWQQFRKRFADFDMNEWRKLSTDDKFRAYVFGIGVKDKNLGRHFPEFAEAESRVGNTGTNMAIFNPIIMTTSFGSANTNASTGTSSSSTSVSSGGGVGGGGGGSGAF